MPRTSPSIIRLSSSEAAELIPRAAKYTLAYFQAQRVKMVLLAAKGWSNGDIAKRLATRRHVVSMWRKRFFTERLAGLEERDRPGRPRHPQLPAIGTPSESACWIFNTTGNRQRNLSNEVHAAGP